MGFTQYILVTGANGQVGTEIRRIASAFPDYSFTFLSREDMPLEDFGKMKVCVEARPYDFLINCAAYTAVDKAETEKELAFKINAEAVGHLATLCRNNNIRLIHFSTDYVFDGYSRIPYKETDATNPETVYGASKLEGERLALLHQPDAIILRTSWVYAATGHNFVKTMLRLFGEKDEINVVNDQIGSPTYAKDLAAAVMHIISSGQWYKGIFHFSNHGAISWYDFARAIQKFSKADCTIHPIPTSAFPTAAKRPVYSVLNKNKIQQHFG
nr:dTDP-4-dehydrorhamnose reductase [Chitinophagaceae bacterium]